MQRHFDQLHKCRVHNMYIHYLSARVFISIMFNKQNIHLIIFTAFVAQKFPRWRQFFSVYILSYPDMDRMIRKKAHSSIYNKLNSKRLKEKKGEEVRD